MVNIAQSFLIFHLSIKSMLPLVNLGFIRLILFYCSIVLLVIFSVLLG